MTAPVMTAPKPCPFCLSSSIELRYVEGFSRAVVCLECHAVGPRVRNSGDAAVRLWNLYTRDCVPRVIENEKSTVKMRTVTKS